jgi:hypothetical protein
MLRAASFDEVELHENLGIREPRREKLGDEDGAVLTRQ